MRIKGKIKTLCSRGFGFISYNVNGSNKEIFFHISNVTPQDRENLARGVGVEFEPGIGNNGRPAAKGVTVDSIGSSIENVSSNYCLPADTLEIIDPFAIDNISLFLNKAAYYNGGKFQYKLARNDQEQRIDPARYNNVPFKQISARREKAIKVMGLTSKSLRLSVEWRLVLGLGGASVYETSMTLHHIYGAPYLPGSAIKGLARYRIIRERFNGIEEDKKNGALGDQGFCHIFGSPGNSITGTHRGSVRFFDAFPVSNPTVSLDVMNPHYGPYYSGDKPPADYHNPAPICFLTVNKADFNICIGINEKDNIPIEKGVFAGKTTFEAAFEWLERTLTEHGIGAKTSVGYGLFKVNDTR